MFFEQFYLGCLAHASYMFGSEGEAVVVDPQRDVEIYLQRAAAENLNIAYIFETHLHADFVSGHMELARRTGAKIYIGKESGATFPHVGVSDGFELKFGNCGVRVLQTPGHTVESMCLLLTDYEKSPQPFAVLTGDTLFIGDVGRPDLSRTFTPQQLAGMLYDSLHQKLLTLDDAVKVYPAHGAGSLCGRNMRAERSSTIGTERLTNYALQIKSREAFIAELTRNLPSRPEYFLQDAEINRSGAGGLDQLPPIEALSPAKVREILAAGGVVLDVRPGDAFAAAHVPGSINISLSGQFASWAGIMLGLHSNPVLMTDTEAQLEEARMRLARVGLDEVAGHLAGGVQAWSRAGFATASTPQMEPAEAAAHLDDPQWQVLDVRRKPEWDDGHVESAVFAPLDGFRQGLPQLDRAKRIAVHCKSGYRSMIAASILSAAGYDVINVKGGFDRWREQKLPWVSETAIIGA
jgi:glyoxylase-like metal-dependent hydrolase (beta-lactamase superfamily II)/rhodanese-related sulfurtransferase